MMHTARASSKRASVVAKRFKASSPVLTKLVTTIGPASEEYGPLQKCVTAGMNVMRLNFSHATAEEFFLRMGNLAKVEGGKQVATLLDTRGPEIRMGGLRVCAEQKNRKAKVSLEQGNVLELTTDAQYDGIGDEKKMYVNYPLLAKKVKPGDAVLLDDGAVVLEVAAVSEASGTATCLVTNSSDLGERKGVNLPGITLDLPPMSEKDQSDIRFCVENGIDVVAASFVHDGEGVRQIREYVKKCVKEVGQAHYPPDEYPLIFAKIESVEAMKNLESIVLHSDGIMVARGDLGVEVPLVEVCQMQKDILQMSRKYGKPCIVATQMLDSMISKPRPTRAEVADVTNAVLDRADAVMLSGESANGDYYAESVQTQRDICATTESWMIAKTADEVPDELGDRSEALALAAVTAQKVSKAKAIAIHENERGQVARRISRYAPDVPVLAFCDSPRVARQLALSRGVVGEVSNGNNKTPAELAESARNAFEGISPVDLVVVVKDGAISMPM